MKALLVYFKGYLKETFLAPVFKLLEASFELGVPLVIAYLVDDISPNKNRGGLVLMVFSLFLLAGLGMLVALLAQYFAAKSAVRFTESLAQDLFDKVMNLSKDKRDKLGRSSLLTRLSNDTYRIQTGINQFLRLFLRAPIIVFGALIMAFRISYPIALLFLGLIFSLFLSVGVISRLMAFRYKKLRRGLDQLVGLVEAQLSGQRLIRAFGQTEREKQEFSILNTTYVKDEIRASFSSSTLSPVTYLFVNIALILVIWQGNIQVGNTLLSQGMLVALVNYLLQILAELIKTAMLVTSLTQAYSSAQRVQVILALEEEHIDADLVREEASDSLALRLEAVEFYYPRSVKPALSGLTFDLGVGECLGIIGGTGSGKTTLVNLLTALERLQGGSLQIYHSGKSPKNIETWRSWISLVPQTPQLFKGTVKENLLLGWESQPVSSSQIWEALEMAQASDFVKEKGGLEAEVASFGRNFSGGQRQRLTIARALLRRTPFLILDDATSALDYLTEARVLEAIKDNQVQTTVIIVSQRTRTLQLANQILVLDQGQQLDLGKHEDLLSRSSVYREIHFSQRMGGSQ